RAVSRCPCALTETGTGVSMQKELIISTTPQETKVAILEDDELVEFYIERHRSQGIVGNIYKGKVTKVLPGMRSAFVEIGLERDAFLYVSDFFEDTEEYDKIVSTVEEEVITLQATAVRPAAPPLTPPPPTPPPPVLPSLETLVEEAMPSAPEEIAPGISPLAPTARPASDDSLDRSGPRRRDRDRDRD